VVCISSSPGTINYVLFYVDQWFVSVPLSHRSGTTKCSERNCQYLYGGNSIVCVLEQPGLAKYLDKEAAFAWLPGWQLVCLLMEMSEMHTSIVVCTTESPAGRRNETE
jgi:hypothetical protein